MNNMGSTKPVASLTNRKTKLQIFDVPAKLGRNDNVVDVHFFHNSVSREHCLFECSSRRFTIKDLGSHMGTFVNGVQLEPGVQYYIEDGDKITIGQVKFVFNADYVELGKREQSAARSGMNQGMQQGMPPAGQSYSMPPGMPQGGFPSDEDARMQGFGGADMQQNPGTPGMSQQGFGGAAGKIYRSPDGRKKAVVSARPLVQFEYDENDVIYIATGLDAAPKKQSYTQDIVKEDIVKELEKEDDIFESVEMHEAFKPVESIGEETEIFDDPEPMDVFGEEAEPAEEEYGHALPLDAEPAGSSWEVPPYEKAEPAETAAEPVAVPVPEIAPEPEPMPEPEFAPAPEFALASEPAPEPEFALAPEPMPAPEFVPEPDDFYEDEPTMVIHEMNMAPFKPRGPVLRLKWRDGETGESGELLADHFPFYIGRKSTENDFAFLKRELSRRHMGFSEKDGAIFVFDDYSTNGVRVNGARIEPGYEIRLMKKDVIIAGNISFVVEEAGFAEV